jgi:hypothetical protein
MRTTFPALALSILAGCHSSDSDPAPQPPPVALSLGLAAKRVYGSGLLRLVAASEEGEGVDLDGDGDRTDVVLEILDLGVVSLTNTGLAFPQVFRSVAGDEVPPPEFVCNDALAEVVISEEETGRDLDEDGIPDEVATWLFDRRTGALRPVPFAVDDSMLGGDLAAFVTTDLTGNRELRVYDGRDGSWTALQVDPEFLVAVSDGIVAFTRSEQGAVDLNADGDTSDTFVLHLYDSDTRRAVNTSFELERFELRIRGGFAGLNVSEAQHGHLDLNGDGDADDSVFVAVNGRDGLTRIPGFSGAIFADSAASGSEDFLLTVPEEDVDRNGDGDVLDQIATIYDARSDRIVDTGLATSYELGMVRTGRWIGVPVVERFQGGQDLDGDGKSESIVPHVFDASTGRSVNLRFFGLWLGTTAGQLLASHLVDQGDSYIQDELFAWDSRTRRVLQTGALVVDLEGAVGDRALVLVRETEEDLNADGDLSDFVLGVYDGRTGAIQSLRVATNVSTIDSHLAPNEQGAALVSESAQGADLNGDGDELDQVLFQIFLDAPQG